MSDKGVVLVSGGMDSLVTAAIAVSECQETYFLHLQYGQKTEERELVAFNQIKDHYHPEKFLISIISYLKQIGNTSLIDRDLPVESLLHSDELPSTYVPFRNAHLLAIAASWAETISANRIYIGAVEEDSSGYPDCRETFLTAFNRAIALGTRNIVPITIKAPLLHLSKKEIVIKGHEMNTPFHLSWSCYQENEIACGVCPSCRLRLKAFREAGIKDPILYKELK